MDMPFIPPWLSNTNGSHGPPSPSVTLTLSPSTAPSVPRAQTERGLDNGLALEAVSQRNVLPGYTTVNSHIVAELVECCRELEEGHRTWMAHKKEAAWRLKRVELQLEAEKASKRKEKSDEIDAKVRALREELNAALDRIEAEYREQTLGLRRDAEAKEQKLAEQWAAKHLRLSKFLEQVGCRQWTPPEMNGR